MVTLARSLAQLWSELRQQNTTSREVELLRQQMQEVAYFKTCLRLFFML